MATVEESSTYVGQELDVFAQAANWKRYLRSRITPFLGKDVLEVGAGIGGTTKHLCQGEFDSWTCLEPDPTLLQRLQGSIDSGELPAYCQPLCGTLEAVGEQLSPDTILYIDVLEHIEADADEVGRAITAVQPGGHVVVLSPAHQWLYTNFDRAIGHYRRYTKASLSSLTPQGARLVRLEYLDSAGLLASAGNRWLLRSSAPNASQVAFWDNVLVRMSGWTDQALFYSIGKSVLGVWQRTP